MTPAPTRTAPCGVCGRPVAQREMRTGLRAAITWWQPDAHTAPCGAPCAAGGVTGRTAAALADALARTHRATSCGTVGCGGGTAGAGARGAATTGSAS